MKKVVITAALTAITMLGMVLPIYAQTAPDVHNLPAYTAESNYMSLPGYLRWQYFQETNNWISYRQAVAMVRDEGVVVASARSVMYARTKGTPLHRTHRVHRMHRVSRMHRVHSVSRMHRTTRMQCAR